MLGLFLSVFAALCFGLTAILQKYCMGDMSKFSFRKLMKNELWMLSVLIALIGLFSYLTALKYEPLSLVQPMLSISIVIPVLFGWFFFKEKIGTRWIHVILITAGVLLLSL